MCQNALERNNINIMDWILGAGRRSWKTMGSWKTMDINSEALNKCFGFQITTTFSNDSFAKKLLNGIDFEDKVDDIKSLSRTLVFSIPISMGFFGIKPKPGIVFRFDVDVVCESGNLKVIERVSIWLLKYRR